MAGRLAVLADQSQGLAVSRITRLVRGDFLPVDFPINGELFFVSAALALAVAGVAVARVLREI